MNRREMEGRGIWTDFQMEKSRAIDAVFAAGFESCCFLDSDILLLNPITHEFFGTKRLVVSPHYIRKRDTDRFG